MKILYKSLIIAVTIVLLVQCKKESEGLSHIVYYPVFQIIGGEDLYINRGDNYVDPGVKVTENGVDIPYSVVSVTGEFFEFDSTAINVQQSNKYSVNYSATSSSGYTRTAGRNVFVITVGDFVTSLEGLYVSDVEQVGGLGDNKYTGLKYIMIRNKQGNEFEISDAMGGYNDIGKELGKGYRAVGITFTVNSIANNDFSFGAAVPQSFGGSVKINSMMVDANAKKISFQSERNSTKYNVVLTQVEAQ